MIIPEKTLNCKKIVLYFRNDVFKITKSKEFYLFFDDLTIFNKITKFTKTLPCFRNDILKITDLEISVILSVFDHFLIIFDDFVSFVIFDKTANSKKTTPCFYQVHILKLQI